jgi:hypothetical protein
LHCSGLCHGVSDWYRCVALFRTVCHGVTGTGVVLFRTVCHGVSDWCNGVALFRTVMG